MLYKMIPHSLFGTLCLLSAISITGGLEIHTTSKVLAACGQNLTLKCNIHAKDNITIYQFYWQEKQKICEYTAENQTGTDFKCERKTSRSAGVLYNYSLTIYDIQPKHEGTYHCKLRSKEGVKNSQTIVRIQKCVGNTSTAVSDTEWSCTFKDVFPEPVVHWNLGNESLTHLAETEVTQSAEGLYTAVSTLKTKKEPSILDVYNCSLFMPLENDKNEIRVEWVRSLGFTGSGGHKLIGHWFGAILAMVSVILLT